MQQHIFIRQHSVKRYCIFLQKMCSITLLFLLAASPALIPARLISSNDDRAEESMEMYADILIEPYIAVSGRTEFSAAGDRTEFSAVGDRTEFSAVGDLRVGIDAGETGEDESIDDRSDDIYAGYNIDVGDRTQDIAVGDARDNINVSDAREAKDNTVAQLTTKVHYMEETVKSLGSTVHKLLMENQSLMKRHKGEVIFHAVLDQKEYTHLHIYDRIYFDTVFLNTMKGYRVNSGMFVAPETGLYIFSSSILSDNGPGTSLFEAEIVMNGIVLARLYGYGVNRYHAQGSATVVTHLNVADHVWVRLSCCGNDSLYGDRYSTFSGALIS